MSLFIIESLKKIVNKKKANKVPILIIKNSNYDDDDEDDSVFIFEKFTSDEDGIVGRYISSSYQNTLYGEDLGRIYMVKWMHKDYAKKIQSVTQGKSPKANDKDTYVGIELEFISKLKHHDIKMKLVEAGLDEYVTLKDDGSIDREGDYHFSHELCIMASQKKFPSVVKKICKILHKNSTVNKSCGMHVHLDMRHRDKDKAYKNLFASQALLYSMVPKSRRDGSYSRFVDTYFSFEQDRYNGERYVGINKQAYSSHKTIECRIHSGSLNADKIINWVKLLVKIADAKNESSTIIKDFKQFKKTFKVRGKLDTYIKERLKNFEDDHKNWSNKVEAA